MLKITSTPPQQLAEADRVWEHWSIRRPHQRSSTTGITSERDIWNIKNPQILLISTLSLKGCWLCWGTYPLITQFLFPIRLLYFSWLNLCYLCAKLWDLIQNLFPKVFWEVFLERSSSKSLWCSFRRVTGVLWWDTWGHGEEGRTLVMSWEWLVIRVQAGKP